MEKALHGFRVLDLSDDIRGAYCAKLLADHGADVIKLEPPEGNRLRQVPPFAQRAGNISGLFAHLNTNKRAIAIDEGSPTGTTELHALFDWCQAVVTDRPLDRLELPARDSLIITSVTPFGSTGPYASWAGSDLICFAMSGIARDTPGNVTDLQRQPPLRAGGRQADYAAGLVGAFGTCAALIELERTGLGQTVDVSEWETLASYVTFETTGYAYDPDGAYLKRSSDRRTGGGYPHTSIGIWPCKDGYVAIAVREQHHFLKFVEIMGNPEWAHDERFMSMATRGQNPKVLNPLILDWLMQHSVQEIWELARLHNLPITPANRINELFDSEQLKAREFFIDASLPSIGDVRLPQGPVKFSETPWRLARPAPGIDEHGDEIRREIIQPSGRPVAASSMSSLPRRKDDRLPLAGIRVIDLTTAAAAPFSTFWLAMLGAEVIKIESREHIDYARRIAPFAEGIPGENRSGVFNSKAINKLSCTINLSTEKGLALAHRLIAKSDVVVENLANRVATKYGFSYSQLEAIRPGIVVASCSLFGRTGPDRLMPGYNETISAFGGTAVLTGYRDGPPGLPGSAWSDYVTGTTLAWATTQAILHQRRTGQGQHVDMSMVEAMVNQIPEAVLDYALNGVVRGRQDNDDDAAAPHGCYPCAGNDQWVAIAVATDQQWQGLLNALRSPTLAADKRLATREGRARHREILTDVIGGWTRKRSTLEAASTLQDHGVPAGPVLTIQQRVVNPHLIARGFYQMVDHPEIGPRLAMGVPFRLGRHPDLVYRPAPVVGQDNDYVFGEVIGLGDEEFAELAGAGVIW